jgi:hypothetical protein
VKGNRACSCLDERAACTNVFDFISEPFFENGILGNDG